MRRKDKEINDRGEINEIISKAQVCRIAMIDGEFPYIIPMNYGQDGNYLYIHSAKDGKKIDILKRNNNISFEMAIDCEVIDSNDPCEFTTKYRSVIGRGKASFVNDLGEKKKGLDVIVNHYAKDIGSFPYPDNQLNRVELIKIEITELTGKKSI